MSVSPIPQGYHSLTPYLIVRGAAKAIDFYAKAFGATEVMRLPGPGGMIMHAELKIGDSIVMLADESAEQGILGPESLGGTGVGICFYLENVDEQMQTAVDAGATVERPIQDQFYGDRSVTLRDPFGHQWTLATHVEDVSPEEIEARMAKMFSGEG